MTPSSLQMQPRSEVGVESSVKHTIPAARHGRPRREIAPESTGTEVVETPCGLHDPPLNPGGMPAGGVQVQLS